MTPYYFYILKCNDGSLYSGVTTDLNRRVREHNSTTVKCSKYTRSRQPVELVYQERVSSRSMALKREAYVKKLKKGEKEELVNRSIRQ